MLENFLKLITLTAIFLNVPVVCAQGWYIGVGTGTSSFDFTDDDDQEIVDMLQDIPGQLGSIPGVDASFSYDDEDTGVKLFAGINVNKNLAVEFGYTDLGGIKLDLSLIDDGSFTMDPSTTYISVRASVDGFHGTVIGKLPISELISLNGRIGLYLWEMDSTLSIQDSTNSFVNGSESYLDDREGEDLFYGIGLDIGWFGISYEIYKVDDFDIDYLGISATYQFN